MASNLENPFIIFIFMSLASSFLVERSSCLSPGGLALNDSTRGFLPALGTWYGDPKGVGSGAACGWGNDVRNPPFSAMIAAGNANIFMHGKGWGDCYQIKCSKSPFCSGFPITVTITDECPGKCDNAPIHFDLSGTAFGALAIPGQDTDLRNLGQVDVEYQRVPCNYGRTKVAFKIHENTNPNWFAAAIEFVDGAGELSFVEIARANSAKFVPMKNIWGAVWQADISPSFFAPFSFRLTSPTKQAITAFNVVPFGFVHGQTYYSQVNF